MVIIQTRRKKRKKMKSRAILITLSRPVRKIYSSRLVPGTIANSGVCAIGSQPLDIPVIKISNMTK